MHDDILMPLAKYSPSRGVRGGHGQQERVCVREDGKGKGETCSLPLAAEVTGG